MSADGSMPRDSVDDAIDRIRKQPHSIEAEMALLGAILSNNRAADRVIGFLKPEHFFDPVHQDIYTAAVSMIGEGKVADPVTLKGYFEADERLQDVGGSAYLGRLAGSMVTLSNAGDYGRTIVDRFKRRRMADLAQDVGERASVIKLDETADEIAAAFATELDGLRQGTTIGGFAQVRTSVAFEQAAAVAKGEGPRLLKTGFSELDAKLSGGLRKGQFIVLAGRPSMGKSALALQIWRNAGLASAAEGGDGSLSAFDSLEMPSEQLGARALGIESGMSVSAILKGEVDRYGAHAWGKLLEAQKRIDALPLYIDDRAGQTVDMIRAAARALARRPQGLSLLIIDHMQKIRGARADTKRYELVTEVSAGLADLAKELDIPVVALAQLSREVEKRDDKRPHMSDLRESGAIEQDADVVMFVYRQEYYVDREEPQDRDSADYLKWQERKDKCAGRAEIIIEKHRNGPIGSVVLEFDPTLIMFKDRQ